MSDSHFVFTTFLWCVAALCFIRLCQEVSTIRRFRKEAQS